MIKINKKYLKKIIKEEARRIAENLPWSEESVASEIERAKELDGDNLDDLLDFDKDDPQEWQDWDVIVSGLSGFIMDKLQDTIEDPRDLDYVERQIEVPLLDMVKGLEGDVIEHLLKALGESPEGEGLTEEKEMKISQKQLAKIIQEEIAKVLSEEEEPRGDFIFPPDHFPINTIGRARNALSRASQYSSAPSWYKGSLDSLVKTVQRRVKAKYPSIHTTDASAEPGKQ